MNSISAQIVSYTHKKSISGLSSSIESRFYLQYFVTFILQNGKKQKKKKSFVKFKYTCANK